VDSEDSQIGLMAREEIDPTKDIYRVTAIWLTNEKGEILIAQRKHTKKVNPGLWGPAVAGTVEEGETYESNAYKELEEELGVTDVTLEKGPKIFVEAPRKYFVQWYMATVDREVESFTIQEEEVEQIRWIPLDELQKDVSEHPDLYVPAMPLMLRLFG